MKSTENTNSSFLTKPVFNSNITPQKIIFVAVLALCFFPFISPPIALLLGLLIAQFVGHPFLSSNNKIVQLLLKFSVVGLGFGMNANSALKAGKEGFVFTVFSIILTFVLGYFVSKLLKITIDNNEIGIIHKARANFTVVATSKASGPNFAAAPTTELVS